MKNYFKISLIISTHNRPLNIMGIINSVQKQVNFTKNYEIIICGSSAEDKLKINSYIKNFLSLNIKYLDSKINHQAYKRNHAALNSSGKYLIFIDDDCFPDKKFFSHHYNLLKLNQKQVIYCGAVEYVKDIKNKKLIKFRNETLISLKDKNSNNVPEKNFISMNMCLPRNYFLLNNYLFDSRFKFYGFEDFEFAYRVRKAGYRIKLSRALVMHKDLRDLPVFLDKFTALVEGVDDIEKLNTEAAAKSIFYKIKKNFIVNLILKIPFIYLVFDLIIKGIILIEKKQPLYCAPLYKIGIFFAFMKGLQIKSSLEKKNNHLLKDNNWYK